MSGAAPADAGLGREKSSRLLLGRDGRKILIGIVLIVLVVFGQKGSTHCHCFQLFGEHH